MAERADLPHCGNDGQRKAICVLKGVRTKPSKKNPEGVVRHGLKKCGACRKQFTVRHGTIFEESHIPLHKWLQAIFLMTSRKKGVSSNRLHRTLEITLKSASFLFHSIREAMRTGEFDPMGGGGGLVETNETYIGTTDEARAKRARSKNPRAFNFHGGGGHKNVVLTLVDRTGQSRSFHVDKATKAEILPILCENLDGEVASSLMKAGSTTIWASSASAPV